MKAGKMVKLCKGINSKRCLVYSSKGSFIFYYDWSIIKYHYHLYLSNERIIERLVESLVESLVEMISLKISWKAKLNDKLKDKLKG